MRDERKKIWIDSFQTGLFWRILAYLAIYFITLGNLMFIWLLLSEGPADPLEQYSRSFVTCAPALLFMVLLLPLLVWDTIRFTHRLVGPVVRIRRALRDIAEEQPVRPITLRDDDFLDELRDDFNRMLETLRKKGVPVSNAADRADNAREHQPA